MGHDPLPRWPRRGELEGIEGVKSPGGDGGGGAVVRYRGLAIAPMTMVVQPWLALQPTRGYRGAQGESPRREVRCEEDK
jgi:hypothetical protein